MKTMRYSLVATAVLTLGLLWPDSVRAQVQPPLPGVAGEAGHGHPIHRDFSHNYFPKRGPYGFGSYSHTDRVRNSGHWHYYPPGVYRDGLRYHYVPGHYQWHNEGNVYHGGGLFNRLR